MQWCVGRSFYTHAQKETRLPLLAGTRLQLVGSLRSDILTDLLDGLTDLFVFGLLL